MKRGIKFKIKDISKTSYNGFNSLFKLFKELLLASSGDIQNTILWLHELDVAYKISSKSYGMADFMRDLESNNFIKKDPTGMHWIPSPKLELALRKSAFESIFGTIKKGIKGRHSTQISGHGDEFSGELRKFEFGDPLSSLDASETIKSAYISSGSETFRLSENDLIVQNRIFQSQCSTVLMIDVSHSMILYGEDRITPAKKVGLALAEFITSRYPKDSLDIIAFGDDAWPITIHDLPYLQVGPYHTNTVAGLELAIEILKKRKNPNKQIMMITDGKPTCIKKGNEYYKNAFGLDRQILTRTLALGVTCRRLDIDISTFMVASDPFLIEFVEEFTKVSQGKAFYTELGGLGEQILIRYENNRKKRP